MTGNTVNSEIQRLKQNVSDAYTAIEQNMGKEVDDTNSDYMNENISEIGKHLQAVVTDDTVTMDIDLDEYEIIDLTNMGTLYEGYLEDIRDALTALGLTPPSDYADYATFITTTFNNMN